MVADIQSFLETGIEGTWTWLTRAYGYPNIQNVMFSVNVIRGLAVFLIATIAFESLIVLYVYPRKDAFAQHILKEFTT